MRDIRSLDELFELLAEGSRSCDGEPVDLLSHGLQCASLLASDHPDDPELQVAGLVHDLGTVIEPRRPATHARTGALAVRGLLGERVASLVEGHDDAKRYLVTVDAGYRHRLSPRSRATLRSQGGLMDPAERRTFEQHPCFAARLALRRADDRAKVPGLAVPDLDHWRAVLAPFTRSVHR